MLLFDIVIFMFSLHSNVCHIVAITEMDILGLVEKNVTLQVYDLKLSTFLFQCWSAWPNSLNVFVKRRLHTSRLYNKVSTASNLTKITGRRYFFNQSHKEAIALKKQKYFL